MTSGHQGLPEGGGGGCWEELEKTRGERRWAGTWGMLGSAVVRPFQTLVLGTSDTASSKSQHSGGPGPIRCRGSYEKSSSGNGQALLPARGYPGADGMGALSWVRSAFMRDEPPEGLGWESSRQRATQVPRLRDELSLEGLWSHRKASGADAGMWGGGGEVDPRWAWVASRPGRPKSGGWTFVSSGVGVWSWSLSQGSRSPRAKKGQARLSQRVPPGSPALEYSGVSWDMMELNQQLSRGFLWFCWGGL